MNQVDLNTLWKTFDGKHNVIVFYSDKKSLASQYQEFSNFFRHEPFNYIIPCGKFKGTSVNIIFSETAIMLSKASLMNDEETFNMILEAKNTNGSKKSR